MAAKTQNPVPPQFPLGVAVNAVGFGGATCFPLGELGLTATVPGAPTDVVATAGDAQASVAFSPPSYAGGSPVTGYVVTASPGGATASGTSSPIVVTGLTNGTAYTFTVHAVNSIGAGSESEASAAVTPLAMSLLSYYSFDAFVDGAFVDEMGARPLDHFDLAAVSATAKQGDGSFDYTRVPMAWGGFAWCYGTETSLGVPVNQLLFSYWIKSPSVASEAPYGAFLAGATPYDHSISDWIIGLDMELPHDGSWHHVAVAAVASEAAFVRIVDGVVDATWTLALPSTPSTTAVLEAIVYGDALLDELAVFPMPSGVTLAGLQAYAARLYAGGAGLFYRAGTGWST